MDAYVRPGFWGGVMIFIGSFISDRGVFEPPPPVLEGRTSTAAG
jgi:hypothetical protein